MIVGAASASIAAGKEQIVVSAGRGACAEAARMLGSAARRSVVACFWQQHPLLFRPPGQRCARTDDHDDLPDAGHDCAAALADCAAKLAAGARFFAAPLRSLREFVPPSFAKRQGWPNHFPLEQFEQLAAAVRNTVYTKRCDLAAGAARRTRSSRNAKCAWCKVRGFVVRQITGSSSSK